MTTTIYHIQSTKPRSETGARPESVFFAWFVVNVNSLRNLDGALFLSSTNSRGPYRCRGAKGQSERNVFGRCVNAALGTYGTEPCAAIRKKIARLGTICTQDAEDLPALLDNAGFSFSVLEL